MWQSTFRENKIKWRNLCNGAVHIRHLGSFIQQYV